MRRAGSHPDPLPMLSARETNPMPFRVAVAKSLQLLLLVISVALQYWAVAQDAASGQAQAPVLTVAVTHSPAIFLRGDTGDVYTLTVTNTGDAATSGTITLTDALPAGVRIRRLSANGLNCPSSVELIASASMVCTTGAVLAPGDGLSVQLLVATATDAPDSVVNVVSVSGGGAPDAPFSDAVPVADRPVFDVLDFSAQSLDGSGQPDTVAGGHPDQATTQFALPTYSADQQTASRPYPVEEVKDVVTELPAGFVGNAAAAPRCKLTDLQPALPSCPSASIVGQLALETAGQSAAEYPVYNMVPERGYPAEFAFKVLNNAVVLYPKLRPRSGQYGVTVVSPGADRIWITRISARLYGVPSVGNGSGGAPVPFLSDPADCLAASPVTKLFVDSWLHPGPVLADGFPVVGDGRWKSAVSPAPPVTGCDAEGLASQFQPAIDLRPTPGSGSLQVDAPSGYRVDLSFAQSNDSTDLSTV
ncbi:MAG TPA: hypothetical protein VGO10_13030, partial [Baekduia sp.]|nr:hypothetical protein [Baekduia sp.]